ncbi:putative spermidine/putrescine transport system permease protein [Leifsonia psychrotolerans]|uniref:Putative spermidine/putrescine transport system permease protein n=1 Tax=Glaciibacter psychrotolerans TaxID=670054 RepID=A0A7Z0J725_9MICO|nr:putative spermidine/putrescine transport system permease protein [Leifsonia psychrotolerans]
MRTPLRTLVLVLPALAILIGVFAYPLAQSMWLSVSDPSLDFSNYVWVFGTAGNVAVILRTFGIALATTVICLALAYPYAYLMTIAGPRGRAALIIIVLIPFWTSLMIRSFAWIILLQDNGLVNQLLGVFGMGPFQLIRTPTGVLIGMVQVLLPFMVLPLYAVMSGIDSRLSDAARSLGARPVTAFLTVFVPLSMPGVLAGALMVFIQSLGFYITPALLGSPSESMISQSIYGQVNGLLQWGRGGALGAVLLLLTLLLLGVLALIMRATRRTTGKDMLSL